MGNAAEQRAGPARPVPAQKRPPSRPSRAQGGGWAHVMAGPGQQLYRRPSSQSSQHGASPR